MFEELRELEMRINHLEIEMELKQKLLIAYKEKLTVLKLMALTNIQKENMKELAEKNRSNI